MENRLFDYMNKRIGGDFIPSDFIKEAGPVITISRQTGCGARGIAWEICEELNKPSVKTDRNDDKKEPSVKTDGNGKWKYISREILQESAEQLNLDPEALKHVIDDKNRGMMDQIVSALSTHSHKSDQKIMKTVQDVIRQFANNGKVIIIGRGGASICRDIKHSLHVRLVAPVDWRIAEIARRLDFSKAYATEYVKKRDEERELLITKLLGKKPDSSAYDVELNRSRFTEKELAGAIINLAQIKGLIRT
ncbi:MAG: cytidylate kinase-like family protein [Bacteroidales bacterium]|nr:cytidylate kinase-like family protein [Bacteroidales bacterium]